MADYGSLTAAEVLERYREDTLPEFLGRPLNDVNERGIFGNTPLHVAAVRGDLAELTALLDGGADINAVGELGYTPLHYAVSQEMLEAAELLLSRGAMKTIGDEHGRTPLDLASLRERDAFVRLLA